MFRSSLFKTILILSSSIALTACLENVSDVSTGESESGGVTPDQPISFSVQDATTGNTQVSNSPIVEVSIKNDTNSRYWCLSEIQVGTPTSIENRCEGGQGPENGWFTSRPSNFTLTNVETNHRLYLWMAEADGMVREGGKTQVIDLDFTPPSVTLDAPQNINLANVDSYTLTGDCEGNDAVNILIDTIFESASCENDRWSVTTITTAAPEGTVGISVSQVDQAGNPSPVASQNIQKDTIRPTIGWTNPTSGFYINNTNNNNITLSGTCTEDGTITISGDISDTMACTTGTFSESFNLSALPEGAVQVHLDITDSATNPSLQVSRNFTKDTVLPSVTITSPLVTTYANLSNFTSFSIQGTCNEDGVVTLGGAASTTVNCTTGSGFSTNINLSAESDGAVTVNAQLEDSAGNNSAQDSVTFNKDIVPPSITQTTFTNGNYSKDNNVIFGGACENGVAVIIGGEDTNSTTCNGAWTYSTSNQTVDATYDYTFAQTDPAGNSSNVTGQWLRDATAPTVSSLSVDEIVTTNHNKLISLQSAAERSDIQAFCLKYNNSTTPILADTCWTNLTDIGDSVTNSYTLTDFPYQIGTIVGNYSLRVWVRDELGNISTQTNALNTDRVEITYNPDAPPSISGVIASSTDSPSDPLISADTTSLIGADLYVKWNIQDNNTIPSGNVSIHYTTDEENFTLLSGGLDNGVNGACTTSGSETGCAHLPALSPTSTYYKIKVEVQDSGVSTVFSTSNPINTGSVNVLAGNTSLGIGGSANSAILRYRNSEDLSNDKDLNSFVVTKTGYVFFIYENLGLTYVSPEDGLLKVLIPETGSSTGDGGNASAATAREIDHITLDKDENLLIWDHELIRKIDLSAPSWPISTLIGGGVLTASGSSATNFDMTEGSISVLQDTLFMTTPDGRLYFERDLEIWYYDPSDQTVNLYLTLSGIGIGDLTSYNHVNYDWSSCTSYNTIIAFNKDTSAITKILRRGRTDTPVFCGQTTSSIRREVGNFNINTGIAEGPHPPQLSYDSANGGQKDGHIYHLSTSGNELFRYDIGSNSLIRILGTGTTGYCSDGNLATSCNISTSAYYVNEFSKVYFLDRGVIRYIDDSGIVQSLIGQSRKFGIGEKPLSARLSYVRYFSVDGDDVYLHNKSDHQILKFSLNGGNMEHIAGDGSLQAANTGDTATTSPLKNGGWNYALSFYVDAADQRLYYMSYNGDFSYIDLATGLWNVDGTTHMDSSDSRISYMTKNNSGKLLFHSVDFHNPVQNSHKAGFFEIDSSTKAITQIYGDTIGYPVDWANYDLCDGVNALTCRLFQTNSPTHQTMQQKYDPVGDNWLIGVQNRNYINTIPSGGGTTNRYEYTVNNMETFDYRRSGGAEYIYYCATDGKLYKRNMNTDIEVELPLPSPTMSCTGKAMHYHSGRDSVIFIMQQNDLYSIAEYQNP